MGLKRRTKRHHNNTPICFAHLSGCSTNHLGLGTEKAKKCNTWSETLKKHPFGRQVENGASRCVHSKKKV